MKPQLAAILLLLVCLPLGLLVWLGEERTRSEQERARATVETVLQDRLLEVHNRLQEAIARVRDRLDHVLASEHSHPRDHVRTEPLVNQMMIGTANGALIHPPPNYRTASEEAFLKRLDDLPDLLKTLGQPRREDESRHSSGWHTWYHASGRHFLYWRHDEAERIIACEVDRMAFLAELIQSLPTDRLENGRISLLDESAYPVYQWGEYEPGSTIRPIVEIQAPEPIESWRLAYLVPETSLVMPAKRADSFFTAGLYALGTVVLMLGGYFYWANRQALREAAQRVNFVNQVSHELKTPLTNIRLYAELAETKLDPEDAGTRACLDIVVVESGRLSRLIQNVLTFAKQQRGTLEMHGRMISPDALIRGVLETFQPALDEAGFETRLALESPEPMKLDGDVVEQVLSNLVSNVLKYAREGGFLGISSLQEGDCLIVRVADYGPGIPAKWRRRVFSPFVRMSSRVTDGVSGTGIGLSIARSLARSHGGSLSLISSGGGTTFTLTLTSLPS